MTKGGGSLLAPVHARIVQSKLNWDAPVNGSLTAETIGSRLRSALPQGDGDYDDGCRDASLVLLNSLLEEGVSIEALDRAVSAMVEAHRQGVLPNQHRPALTIDGAPMPAFVEAQMPELSDELLELDTEAARSALTSDYEAWLKLEGLNLGSADEHYQDASLTLAQLDWLHDFGRRWDRNDYIERLQAEAQPRPR